MLALGAAPALVAYTWTLKDLGTMGWIGAFIYCAGTGIRFARFNANIGVVDKRFFQGLPSPSGAAVMAGLDLGVTHFGFEPADSVAVPGVTTVVRNFSARTVVFDMAFYHYKMFYLQPGRPLP